MIKLFGFLALISSFAFAQPPVAQLPLSYIDTTYNSPTGTTWHAHTTVDLQNDLSSAKPGDTIILDAGSTYVGNFSIKPKTNPNHKWIYIVSSGLASLPAPGTRINPSTDVANMAHMVTANAQPVFRLYAGASFYRFVGLELSSASTFGCYPQRTPPQNCYSAQLLFANSMVGQPLVDSITVDRCYLHGSPTQDIREGIIANASNFAVVDSYISDIHQGTFDSQAVIAWFSPGPIKIVNNFLSATTEDIMFGGAGGPNNPWVPSDIEIRNNHLYKSLAWAQVGITIPPKNQWVMKNNLEVKSARRVLVDSNVLENTWVAGQTGFSVVLTVRTGQSGNLAVVDDITVRNNVLKSVVAGFQTMTSDYNCNPANGCTNPGESRRINIYNNLLLFRAPTGIGDGPAYGIMVSPDFKDLVLQHNTFIPAPSTKCANAVYFEINGKYPWPPPVSITHNVWLLDNVTCRQPSGDSGGEGTTGLGYYMGDPTPMDPRFMGNVMFAPSGDQVYSFPAHNYATATGLVYVDPQNGNYQLASPDWTDTSDGKISGIDSSALPAY